jgi:hypothetical protein
VHAVGDAEAAREALDCGAVRAVADEQELQARRARQRGGGHERLDALGAHDAPDEHDTGTARQLREGGRVLVREQRSVDPAPHHVHGPAAAVLGQPAA